MLGDNFRIRLFGEGILGGGIEWKDDITSWVKDKDAELKITITFSISKEGDAAISKFFTELILKESTTLSKESENLIVTLILTSTTKDYNIKYGDNQITEKYQQQEILNRLKNTQCLLFHNSTSNESIIFSNAGVDRLSNYLNSQDKINIEKKRDELTKLVSKALKHHEEDLAKLLGNLEDKYDVSLSTQGLKIERESINISLKEKNADVSLDDWGSGTKNRTLIFLNMLNAKKLSENPNESYRITPIVIIEEPESFLHPQAQAEFGRILQDLAHELKIQVIVTTHSPYLLSFKSASSNILLERNTKPKSKDVASYVRETIGEKWYEPFAQTLGVNAEDFGPLKEAIFSTTSQLLLVEGEIDKKYFEQLQNNVHGTHMLKNDIEIFAYGGADSLKNNVLMNFIKSRFAKVVITVDYDRFKDVQKSLQAIGFSENVNLFAIGKNESGKDAIEGLIPDNIVSKVYGEHVEDVRKLACTQKDVQKSAKNALKRYILDAFLTEEYNKSNYTELYKLTGKLNKAFK